MNPLSVEVTVPTDPIKRGRWFKIIAQVSNAGSTHLDNVAITLVHPAGLRLDRNARQTLAQVPASGTKSAKWEACSNTPGGFIVLARAEVGSFIRESPAQVVQIVGVSKNC